AFVLPLEQLFQLFLQRRGPPGFFGGFEGIHRGTVVVLELLHERRGSAGVVEREGFPGERDFVWCHSGASKSLGHVALDSPGEGTDSAPRRWGRIAGADLQDLAPQRRSVGNPVAHHNSAARTRDAHRFPRHIQWPGQTSPQKYSRPGRTTGLPIAADWWRPL